MNSASLSCYLDRNKNLNLASSAWYDGLTVTNITKNISIKYATLSL